MHHISQEIPMWGSLGTGTLPRYLGCITSPRISPCGDHSVQEYYLNKEVPQLHGARRQGREPRACSGISPCLINKGYLRCITSPRISPCGDHSVQEHYLGTWMHTSPRISPCGDHSVQEHYLNKEVPQLHGARRQGREPRACSGISPCLIN